MKQDKNSKSLEIFKKGFRKNEVVIYAIALMLVTAGYFNYTANVENRTMETYSQEEVLDKSKIAENETINNTTKNIVENIAKTQINENDEAVETITNNSNQVKEQKENNDNNDGNNENNNSDDEDIGDAKLVDSKSVVDDSSDYFVSTKLQRDTNYADTLSTYKNILEDSSVSETQKSIAMKEITKINDTKNAISICENLLSTKGFEHYVVLVNNESINVVVKVEGGLTKQKVAQIQNIISREFKCEIDNIHILEKK